MLYFFTWFGHVLVKESFAPLSPVNKINIIVLIKIILYLNELKLTITKQKTPINRHIKNPVIL